MQTLDSTYSRVHVGLPSRIRFYPDGVETFAGDYVVAKRNQIGGKRGAVTGWSKASRSRMRTFMLENEPPADWPSYGVTVTIPGPVVEPAEAKRFWEHFSHNYIQAKGWCMVWRVERQQRGQYHWHCIVSVPPDVRPGWITACAFDALEILGPCTGLYYNSREKQEIELTCGDRMAWPGAYKHAVEICEDTTGAWKRYLQDHATKNKQEQLGAVGRQWGIVGRKHYARAMPLLDVTLSRKEHSRLMRMMRRMMTPRVKDPEAPFGCKLGYQSKRGKRGRSVWFSEPSKQCAIQRMVRSVKDHSNGNRGPSEN